MVPSKILLLLKDCRTRNYILILKLTKYAKLCAFFASLNTLIYVHRVKQTLYIEMYRTVS